MIGECHMTPCQQHQQKCTAHHISVQHVLDEVEYRLPSVAVLVVAQSFLCLLPAMIGVHDNTNHTNHTNDWAMYMLTSQVFFLFPFEP
jgi:hypothetical protein